MFAKLNPIRNTLLIASTLTAGWNLLLSPGYLHCQTSASNDTSAYKSSRSIHPLAQARFDRGAADDSVYGRALLILKRSPEQEAALRELVADQQDSTSSRFHQWLTPEQFGQQFGVADSEVQGVIAFLQSNGFTVGRVYKNKSAIEISGTAGQLRDTFRANIHKYSINGHEFLANESDPVIPAEIASVVSGFASLNNFNTNVLEDEHLKTLPVTVDERTHKIQPQYTGTSGGGAYYLLAPADIDTIYNIPTLTTSPGAGGNGVTVGVIGDSQINVNLIQLYQTLAGITVNLPIEIVDGPDPVIIPTTSGTDATIAYEQLELISAAAPNAKLIYYTSGSVSAYDTGLDFAMIRAIEDNAVSVLTIGFQTCEANLTAGGNQLVEAAWLQAAAQGITVVTAAGDSGSAGCDIPGISTSTNGLAVNGYASTPYATAVGGTDFYYGNPAKPTNYWSATNSSTYGSAESYIPEQAWNDSIQTDDYIKTLPSIVYAGGGGFSSLGNVAANGVTESAYPVPSWQVSAQEASGIGTPTARSIPDLAMFAGNGYNNASYAICAAPGDCETTGLTATFVGGTAGAAGVFAGIMAEVVEKYGLQGNANLSLYALASSSAYHSALNGTTNSVACSAGTGCTGGYLKSAGVDAYKIGGSTTYNLVTGLGSVNATNLINSWKVPATVASTTTLTVASTQDAGSCTSPPCALTSGATVVHGTFLNLTATITGSDATGNVAFYTNSSLPAENGNEAVPVVAGVASAPGDELLPGGSYNLTARYGGDGKYLPSVGTFALTVTPEPSVMLFWNGTTLSTTAPSATTIVYGTPYNITVEPFSLNYNNVALPTGTVGVYNNGANDPFSTLPISSEGTSTFSTNLLNGSQTYSLVFKYAGDPSFQPSTTSANPVGVTVQQIATNTVLAAEGAASSGTPVELTATISPGVSIQAGGPGVAGGFAADEDYTGGSAFPYAVQAVTVPVNLVEPAPAAVYGTARQGASFSYTIPGLTSGGNYTVRLHFAELYWTAAGKRLFNVAINGTTVLTNFDIFASAGGEFTAVVESFPNIVANSSGQIVIAFSSGTADQPLVNGIEVQLQTGVPPTGTVTFNTAGGSTVATLAPAFNFTGQAMGVATIPVTPSQIPTGGSITATYSSDGNYLASSLSLPLATNANTYSLTSTLNLSLNSSTVTTTGTLTLTATATDSDGSSPQGTIQVYAGGVSIGSFTIASGSGGVASWTVPLTNGYLPFASGTVAITAVFTSGKATIAPSSAEANVTVTDTRTVGDFSISTDRQSQTITSSSNVTFFEVQLAALQNFGGPNSPVTLTCTVPTNSNLGCNVGSGSVVIGSSGFAVIPVELYGQPTGGTGALRPPVAPQRWWIMTGGPALACIFILGIPARRRGLQGWIAALVCVALVSGSMTGCGTGSNASNAAQSSSPSSKGGAAGANYTGGLQSNMVPTGTYTVVLTGTATTNTTLVHNTAVTVIVSAGQSLANGNYSFLNFSSNTYMTDPGASTTSGTGLVLNPADNTTDQAWTFTYQNNGYYLIQNQANGLYLTDPGGNTGDVQASQQTATGDGTQLWTLNSLGGGFEVVNAQSGGVLDDDGFGTAAGTEVICWPQKAIPDGINQTWYIQPTQ